jgi:hypothetical protein
VILEFDRHARRAVGWLALAFASLAGCQDNGVAPHRVPPPPDQMANLGTYIVHVDLRNRTVDVRSASQSPNAPAGVSARFYGLTTEIEHVFAVSAPTPIGISGAEYHLRLHINNLEPFAIGTNSPHTAPAFPQDTMGVYVYQSIPPYNITCSSACGAATVVMDSADGAYPFFENHGLAQPYLYFKTILEPGTFGLHSGPGYTDQTGMGGIDYFRTFNFRTSGSVAGFSFGIAVSAPFVSPNETRWKVFYVADSLPNRKSFQDLRSEPDWRISGTAGGDTAIVPAGCAPNTGACALQITSFTPVGQKRDTLMYYRSDSVLSSQDAYITATLTIPNQSGTVPTVFLGLQDQTKLVRLGISTAKIGFTDTSGAFVGTTANINPQHHTYRVAKFGIDSAAVYAPPDSVASVVRISYASLPAAPAKVLFNRFFFFGNLTRSSANTASSLWTSVNYEVGAHAP